jgi:hypothetical protein
MVIDFTQIEHVEETRDQCEIEIEDLISYIESEILVYLDNFLNMSKDDQAFIIKEVVSFSAELNHTLKQIHELDINNSNPKNT